MQEKFFMGFCFNLIINFPYMPQFQLLAVSLNAFSPIPSGPHLPGERIIRLQNRFIIPDIGRGIGFFQIVQLLGMYRTIQFLINDAFFIPKISAYMNYSFGNLIDTIPIVEPSYKAFYPPFSMGEISDIQISLKRFRKRCVNHGIGNSSWFILHLFQFLNPVHFPLLETKWARDDG